MTTQELIQKLIDAGYPSIADCVRTHRAPGRPFATPQELLEYCEDKELFTPAKLIRKYLDR